MALRIGEADRRNPEERVGHRGCEHLDVGAIAETAPGERRVALSPDGAARLLAADHQVIIETGAGDGAWFTDPDYAAKLSRAINTTLAIQRAQA